MTGTQAITSASATTRRPAATHLREQPIPLASLQIRENQRIQENQGLPARESTAGKGSGFAHQTEGGWPAGVVKTAGGLCGLISLLLLTGCGLQPLQELLRQGHGATVDCLHGERAQTDGDELRCEDWAYVRQNYLKGGR